MLKKVIYSIFISGILASCASVPMTDANEDQEAKLFQAPKEKSRIYIFRDENLGSAIKVPVTIDGKSLGQTAPQTYFVVDIEPGKHELACFAESNSELTVDSQKGKANYIWQEMKMGFFSARCKLSEVSETEGQSRINSCKRAKTTKF